MVHEVAHRVAAGRFDLDHLGAEIGELTGRERSRYVLRQVDDTYIFEQALLLHKSRFIDRLVVLTNVVDNLAVVWQASRSDKFDATAKFADRSNAVCDGIAERRITLQCECEASDAALGAAIADSIRSICKLRGEVEFVASGSLPNDGKVIDDIRQYE